MIFSLREQKSFFLAIEAKFDQNLYLNFDHEATKWLKQKSYVIQNICLALF